MVAPLLAAAFRAIASQAGRQAVRQLTKKAATQAARQTSAKAATDIIGRETMEKAARKAANQAIKRYESAAKRYESDAKKVGENSRYGQMLKKASYRVSKFERELRSVDFSKGLTDSVDSLIAKSDDYLAKATKTKAARSDLLGETLLNGTMQGHRFFSITKSLWEDVGYEQRYELIREKFGGKSLGDIILQIEEETGVNIMKGDINSDERYGNLTAEERSKVMKYIIANYG